MKHYSMMKRNMVLTNTVIQVNLEKIMLSKRSQSQKITFFTIQFYKISRTDKSIDTESN